LALVTQIIGAILGLLEILLGMRVVLKVIAANPDVGFATFVYGITKPFLAPFTALVGTPKSGGTILEVTTLIAMAVYALLFWIVIRAVRIAATRPTARTITRSVSQQTPDGTETERTTRTTRSG
jgi:YggT family protein